MEVECRTSIRYSDRSVKKKDDLLTLEPFVETLVAGSTPSIIESLVVLERLIARGKQSAASGGNGRRVICADRPLRLTAAPRER